MNVDDTDLEILRLALPGLTPRQYEVVELLFGFRDGNQKTCTEVANMLKVSRSMVSSHSKSAFRKLRRVLRGTHSQRMNDLERLIRGQRLQGWVSSEVDERL